MMRDVYCSCPTQSHHVSPGAGGWWLVKYTGKSKRKPCLGLSLLV